MKTEEDKKEEMDLVRGMYQIEKTRRDFAKEMIESVGSDIKSTIETEKNKKKSLKEKIISIFT